MNITRALAPPTSLGIGTATITSCACAASAIRRRHAFSLPRLTSRVRVTLGRERDLRLQCQFKLYNE
jgi:hypothetical protein